MTHHKPHNDPSGQNLASRLKATSAQATTNPWFTRRVLNRLPEKRTQGAGLLGTLCYILMIIVCAMGWTMVVLHKSSGVVTVGNIAFAVTLGAITIGIACSLLRTVLHST